MASVDILYEMFELYLKKAKESQAKGDLVLAKKYYMLSAEQMLKVAKENTGELQKSQLRRAKSLIEIAKGLGGDLKTSDSSAQDECDYNVKQNDKITLEEALQKLNNLEGLSDVKTQICDWIDQIKVFNMRKEMGLAVPDMSYHMVFTGNPGTGKTTVARIMAQIYCAMGILSEGQLVEVARDDLVAEYVGKTAIKTKEALKKAYGGVLFIDEAYTLVKEGTDFGQEAIDTILKFMEDNRNNLVVIVAGYDELMEKFIESNPGLPSRFKNFIRFSDYNGQELLNIFISMCKQNQYLVDKEALLILKNYFNQLYLNRGKTFGNGRDVRNVFESTVTKQSKRIKRISADKKLSVEEVMTFTSEDLPLFILKEGKSDAILLDEQPKDKIPEAEEKILTDGTQANSEFKFEWNDLPEVSFDDVAGLDEVKDTVNIKVILPIKNPEAFEGYVKKNGGGVLLYGPPGTGKTMIAAAIANEIGAKFCSVKPSDLLYQGAGQSEKAIRALFAQAREFKCAVIYFDEMDSISPKNTKSQYAKQLRSEFLAQLQGLDSYKKETDHILFLIASTNKPWDIDSAFIRPGRFGTRIYIGLPDEKARKYLIDKRLSKIISKGIVNVADDIDIDKIVEKTAGYNGSDITNLMDKIEEISILRGIKTGEKTIVSEDFDEAIKSIPSTVQREDIEKLMDWKSEND